MLVFDLETNGFLNVVHTIHCLHIYDYATDKYERYDKEDVPKGVERLAKADTIIGHNIIGYDLPVIRKLYPAFSTSATIVDTLVLARMVYSNIKATDFGRFSRGELPGKLIGTHKLEAYGYRLGLQKGEYGKEGSEAYERMKDLPFGIWTHWSIEMSDYCELDVRVTKALYDKILTAGFSKEAADLEKAVADIILRQERLGILFDVKKAQVLYSKLIQIKAEKLAELQRVFKPWWRPIRVKGENLVMTPKVKNSKFHTTVGCPFTKVELVEFNPGSNSHIEYWLKKKYDWEPVDFTEPSKKFPQGQVMINDEIISALPYPETKPLGEYLTAVKRISQLSDGDEAWLKAIQEDGRIHGYVNSLGAGTRRMTHSKPNLAQVPAGKSPFGMECRELFIVRKLYKLVGCDAAGLELRCLAHYMARYDGGAYGRASVSGRKEDGTDVHTVNQRAIGADTRDIGKTWFYAFIYGAGIPKLGRILLDGEEGDAGKVGAKSKASFAKGLPALKKLSDAIQKKVKEEGFLLSIDGQKVHIRSAHSALNFLLQGAGAIVMKMALVILEAKLQALGLKNSDQIDTDQPIICKRNYDYEFLLNVHDEWQIEVKDEHAETVGQAAKQAIVEAGLHFKFKCPLDGEYAIGNNWAETH